MNNSEHMQDRVLFESYKFYFSTQCLQWVSYAAVFSVLLSGAANSYLATLYVAVLALIRGFSSLVFSRASSGRIRYLAPLLLGSGALLSFLQLYLAIKQWQLLFLVITGIKFGMLTYFQVWRDALSSLSQSHRVRKSHGINVALTSADYLALTVGGLMGAVLMKSFDPLWVIGLDSVLFGLCILHFFYLKPRHFYQVFQVKTQPQQQGWTSSSLYGHLMRSIADAGFQGIFPVVALIHMALSPTYFSLLVGVSGILIVLGSEFSRWSFKQAKGLGPLCLVYSLVNAISLGLCLTAESTLSFQIFLFIACFSSGAALALARTLSFSGQILSMPYGGPFAHTTGQTFSAYRWFGISLGSFGFSYLASNQNFQMIVAAVVILLVGSGVMFWFSSYRSTSKATSIGSEVRRVLIITCASLFFISLISLYFSIVYEPIDQRRQLRQAMSQPYLSLLSLNLKISDMAEALRLTRQFEFPEGMIKVKVTSAVSGTLIESYAQQGSENKEVRGNQSRPYLREHSFSLSGVGPIGEDVRVIIHFDDRSFIRKDLWSFVSIMGLVSLVLYLLYQLLSNSMYQLLRPLREISRHLKGMSHEDSLDKLKDIPLELAGRSSEVMEVLSQYNHTIRKSKELSQRLGEAQTQIRLQEQADQVAHDIRSPIVALETVVYECADQLPAESSKLLKMVSSRIRDVANNLTINRTARKSLGLPPSLSTQPQNRMQPELLVGLLESMISEKRQEFKDWNSLKIESHYAGQSALLFSKLDASEFKRVLSNLINNAVESIADRTKEAFIMVRMVKVIDADQECAFIQIEDTGRGISAEKIPHIFKRGVSIDKPGGTGLGLSHAKEVVEEKLKGKLSFSSRLGEGSVVSISLPLSSAPEWICSEFSLNSGVRALLLDDDCSIHEVWRQVFKASHAGLISFTSFPALKAAIAHKEVMMDEIDLFLIDYDLKRGSLTGLEIISSLGISERAILVSSHFEDPLVVQRAREMRVKILPKLFIPHLLSESIDRERRTPVKEGQRPGLQIGAEPTNLGMVLNNPTKS